LAVKRAFDVAASALGLILLAPVLLAAAVAVRCGSRGPAFFLQERVGRNMRPFRICKFRTMVADAPARGGQITAGEDPRITGVGRYLRKSKIDELPQLWNVLKGDMSLVGPRPEVPKYVAMFPDDFRQILVIRPGITDAASVQFRDEAAVLAGSSDPEAMYVTEILPEKLALAKQYLREMSLVCDLRILWRTLWRIAS
jgi:lipopolysaccharide/colanic/teichoic acid biosynthesis glycosyltransferase